MNSNLLFLGYAISLAVEVYFFLMQRVPLEVSRENDINPAVGRFMLPSWFSLAWIAKLSKWAFLAIIWWRIGWIPVIACFLVGFAFGMVVPVPYTHFAGKFERRLKSEMDGPNAFEAGRLLTALKASRDKHGF